MILPSAVQWLTRPEARALGEMCAARGPCAFDRITISSLTRKPNAAVTPECAASFCSTGSAMLTSCTSLRAAAAR